MPLPDSRWVQLVSKKYADAIPFPIKMIIFFASNPEIELSAKEIASKWGLAQADARRKGRKLVEQGFLTVEHKPGRTQHHSSHYRAGPVIRAELGYDDQPTRREIE